MKALLLIFQERIFENYKYKMSLRENKIYRSIDNASAK